jgi:beta-lactamase regulating signal transducer with metallopeptidase domain
MSAILHAISPSIIAFLIQSVVVSAIAIAVGQLMARRGAAFRIAVYRAGILSILTLTIAGPAMRLVAHPWWAIADRAAGPHITAERATDESTLVPQVGIRPGSVMRGPSGTIYKAGRNDVTSKVASSSDLGTAARSSEPLTTVEIVGLVSLLGSIGFLVLIGTGSTWVLLLGKECRQLTDSWLKTSFDRLSSLDHVGYVRLAQSPRVSSAFVAGIRRPTIYLPSDVEDNFGVDQIEAILCHELVHVRQGDCLWALLARLSCAVSWLNPFSWLLSRQLSSASEELCDQQVLNSGIEPATYAGCLLRVAETIVAKPAQRLVGAGVLPAKSQLTKRITNMLNNTNQPSASAPRNPRLRIAAVAAVCAIAACLLVSAESPRHDTTPEATVQGMVDALNKHDWNGLFSRIEGARIDEAVATLKKVDTGKAEMPQITPKLSSVKITGDSATVQVNIRIAGGPNPPLPEQEEVTLHRVDGDWKISGVGEGKRGLFSQLVMVARDPKMMAVARASAGRTVVLSNMKQIALAVIMYSGDHNDKFALTQATLKSAVKPYLRNDKLFVDPDGKPLDVRFNSNLTGKSELEIAAPAETVLLSLGPKGSLQFTDDKTIIAYADGHVKFVTKNGVAQLKWK